MQSLITKKLTFFSILFSLLCFNADCQDKREVLQKGDSLFQAGLFTKAHEYYNQLYFEKEVFTPSMLLKLAKINEGLGNTAEAFYFLETYRFYFPEKDVLKKMESLAEKHRIAGYDYTDVHFFDYLFRKYYFQIAWGGLALLGLLFIYNVLRHIYGAGSPLRRNVITLILGAFVFLIVNRPVSLPTAVVRTDYAPLMQGPTAGASKEFNLRKGEKIHLIEKTDVWYKVRRGDLEGYVREGNLYTVPLNADAYFKGESFSLAKWL